MLNVQEYLQSGKTLEELSSELGIKVTKHETLPLVILNYDQIESPKTHPIVMECRALVLEVGTWDVVARAFPRFFNLGEAPDITGRFDWTDFSANSKEDGSLILLYNYKGQWMVNTRGTFGEGEMFPGGPSWKTFFLDVVFQGASPDCCNMHHLTTVFELCSSFNKVVREYRTPTAYITAAFNIHGMEFSPERVRGFFPLNDSVKIPQRFYFGNVADVESFVADLETSDPTFEGVVLCDCNGIRIKVKNKKYLTLHKMKGNGNLFLKKNLLPWVLDGDTAELLTYYPEAKPMVDSLEAELKVHFSTLGKIFEDVKNVVDQKTFALYITKENPTPFNGILFRMKKENRMTYDDLVSDFRASEDLILKVVDK